MSGGVNRRNFLKFGAIAGTLMLDPSLAQASVNTDITHGSRSKNMVALTFHGGGPRKLADALLNEFAKTSTPISVFAVGIFLQQQPDIAKLILSAGHDLGNHTMHHLAMNTLSKTKIKSEILECAAELKKLTGSQGKYFRPSGTTVSTADIRAAAVKAGYGPCITYDVDPLDYTEPGAAKVVSRVMKAVKPGSIIGMHFGYQSTIKAIPALLKGLNEKGLTPVTLSTLLA